MNKEVQDYERKQKLRKVINVFLIFVMVLLLGVPVFAYFRISSGGRFALREAKNVRLAYEALIVEYYGNGHSIYNPKKKNGMNDGVEDRLKEVTQNEGEVTLIDYDEKRRKVLEFTYEAYPYRVTYNSSGEKDESWDVDFFMTIQRYNNEH